MAYCIDYPLCTICGTKVGGSSELDGWLPQDHWSHRDWMARGILLSGPHWWFFRGGPRSMTIPNETVTLQRACASWYRMEVCTIPQHEEVYIQCESDAVGEENKGTNADSRWYLLIHSACEEIARKVMESSREAFIRSIGDLWMTLDQRCAKSWGDPDYSFGVALLPQTPVNQPGELLRLGLGAYYISQEVLSGEERAPRQFTADWWNHDPIQIPNLAISLLANLQPYKPRFTISLPFQDKVDSLPGEIKNIIATFLVQQPLRLECNYIMPQIYWKQAFSSLPFLWDLDLELVDAKMSQLSKNTQWDWEKLTRQLMSRVEMVDETDCKNPDIWSYKKVGLDVPPGFNNRRRMWQILEEMYPNDVKHVQPDWEDGEERASYS